MAAGRLITKARGDARRRLKGDFSVEITITPPNDSPVVIRGLATNHSMIVDTDGLPAIGKNYHVTFYELELNDEGVETRNEQGDVSIAGFLISWTDAITTQTYKIQEAMPDSCLGLIRCILDKYDE